MATAFAYFRPTPALSSTTTNHRKPDSFRRKATSSSSSSSSNWWTPLFGWSSDPDYITSSGPTTEPASTDTTEPVESEAGRSRSKFALGGFTEEKAKKLRRKTMETSNFHDLMYHSAIATRLASDISDP